VRPSSTSWNSSWTATPRGGPEPQPLPNTCQISISLFLVPYSARLARLPLILSPKLQGESGRSGGTRPDGRSAVAAVRRRHRGKRTWRHVLRSGDVKLTEVATSILPQLEPANAGRGSVNGANLPSLSRVATRMRTNSSSPMIAVRIRESVGFAVLSAAITRARHERDARGCPDRRRGRRSLSPHPGRAAASSRSGGRRTQPASGQRRTGPTASTNVEERRP